MQTDIDIKIEVTATFTVEMYRVTFDPPLDPLDAEEILNATK
jgi:hypothetical protein